MKYNHRYILTGGPGTGKSTILDVLQKAGHLCLPESAREIIKHRIAAGLEPRPDPQAFASAILQRDIEQYLSIPSLAQPVFIDRGIADALCMLEATGAIGLPEAKTKLSMYPLNQCVFFFYPWEAIYCHDDERDQSFEQCQAVCRRLESWYENLGFTLIKVPNTTPELRADFILNHIAATLQDSSPEPPSPAR